MREETASAYCRRLTLINRPRRTLAIAVVKKKQLEVGRYATDKCRLGCERNGTQFIQDRCTVVCQLDISVIANVISDSKSKTINELTSTHRHCHIHYPYPMREGEGIMEVNWTGRAFLCVFRKWSSHLTNCKSSTVGLLQRNAEQIPKYWLIRSAYKERSKKSVKLFQMNPHSEKKTSK